MDLLGLALYYVSFLPVGNHFYDRFVFDDWEPLEGRYIEVYDLSTRSDHQPNIRMRTEVDGGTRPRDFHDFPPQDVDTFRVYVVHGSENDEALQAHVEQITSIPFSEFLPGRSGSIVSPLNRRLQGDEMSWWQDGIYTFGTGSGSEGLFPSLVRCHVRLRCVWRENRMLCFLFCEAETARYTTVPYGINMLMFGSIHSQLRQLSANIIRVHASIIANQGNGTSRLMQQRTMILCVCYAVLIGHADLFPAMERPYKISLQRLNDPGRTTITTTILQDLARDSYFWEQIQQSINKFLLAVESFQSSLQLMDDLRDSNEFQETALEIRGLSAVLERQASLISTRLDNRLRFLEIGRTLHESRRVQLLSLLAIIFLPLSLASSILSMQTRFVDLHYLLYDFFGVIFLLGTLTFILLGILLFFQWGYGKFKNWLENLNLMSNNPPGRGWFSSVFRTANYAPIYTILFSLVPWVLILTSFMLGMLRDVGLGLKVLGYGFGGITALLGGFVFSVWIVKQSRPEK